MNKIIELIVNEPLLLIEAIVRFGLFFWTSWYATKWWYRYIWLGVFPKPKRKREYNYTYRYSEKDSTQKEKIFVKPKYKNRCSNNLVDIIESGNLEKAKKYYLEISKKHHPDKGGDETIMKELNSIKLQYNI